MEFRKRVFLFQILTVRTDHYGDQVHFLDCIDRRFSLNVLSCNPLGILWCTTNSQPHAFGLGLVSGR